MSDDTHRQPDYYQSSVETIDCILACGYESAVGFCKGNIIKYTMRYREKGGLADLKKASWYLNLLYAIENFVEEGGNWALLPTARTLIEKYCKLYSRKDEENANRP